MARSRLRDAQFFDEDVLAEDEHSVLTHYFKDLGDVDPLAGNAEKYLRVDALASGIEYAEIETTGSGSWDKHLDDNEKIFFGTDNDVEMYFDGTDTIISGSQLSLISGNSGATPHSSTRLLIEDNTAAYITLATPSSDTGLMFADPDSATVGMLQYVHNDDSMRITTGGAERMRVMASGVGIGATNINTILHIKDYEPVFRIEDTRTDDIWDIRSQYGNAKNNFRIENNNDTFFEITENGVVSHAVQSGCSAYVSSAQSISNNTTTVVEFDTELWDIQNEFDNSTNYRFTADEDGKYLVATSVKILSLGAGKTYILRVYKNGSVYKQGARLLSSSSSTADIGLCMSCVVDMATNDYIDVRIYHNHGSALDLEGWYGSNWLNVQKVA